MKIQNGYYTGRETLFHGEHLEIGDTIFGEGESPLKESSDITLKNSMFQWKYPLWYSKNVVAQDCTWAEMARAGVWYTDNLQVKNALIEASKNFRRCKELTAGACIPPTCGGDAVELSEGHHEGCQRQRRLFCHELQ